MSRIYSVKDKSGRLVGIGTFSDRELLEKDYPPDRFELFLDVHLEPEPAEQDYREYRKFAYPPLADLADALYWQQQGDETRMQAYLAACAEVKAKFPKSN